MTIIYSVNGADHGEKLKPLGFFFSVTKAKECAEVYISRKVNELERGSLSRMISNESAYVRLYGETCTAHIEAEAIDYDWA